MKALLGIIIALVLIIFISVEVKKCNERRDLENSPYYKEVQEQRKRIEDSIKNLNELAKTNPEEYNRIMQEHEEQLRKGKMWRFSTQKDEKTKTDNVWATIKSINRAIVYMPEPLKKNKKGYSSTKDVGECYITIRYMKQNGTDVLVRIPDLPAFNEPKMNHIFVWFGSMETPIKYDYTKQGDYVFLKKGKNFIEHCKKVTYIKFKVPFVNYTHKDDEVIFEFEVSEPLVWKYK